MIASGIPYTFIRPSYFMQNLITTLKSDIKRGAIFLPAGNAKFLWVDVDDIGKVIAQILKAPVLHQNKVYTITGSEYFTFGEVATLLSKAVAKKICYESPG
ncbi:MAG TPA: NmrA family NAD(P)-binding protein [Chryseolinea sp.]